MYYYNEIIKELENISEEQITGYKVKESCLSFFKTCAEYYSMNKLSSELNTAKNVLAYYISEDSRLTSSYSKTNKEPLPLITKLYIEGLWNLYNEKNEPIHNVKTERKFLNEFVFGSNSDISSFVNVEVVEKETLECFVDSLRELQEWVGGDITFRISKLHFDNLHETMQIIKNHDMLFSIPESECVTAMLTEETLENILYYLQEKDYGACTFYLAAIRRALTTGEINSYTPYRDNKTVYFKERYEYNYEKLSRYIKAVKNVYYEDYCKHTLKIGRVYWS